MDLKMFCQFAVVLAVIALGARKGGVALGLWGGVGLLLMILGFGVPPTAPPVDVLLIIMAVIMAASVMDAAGGIDYMVRFAEKIIRRNPRYVTIVSPLVVWVFTFLSGTGHIVYPLLPVIYEVAHQNGVRPERPMSIATITSIIAIPASPVAAATAAMIALLHDKAGESWGVAQIMMIAVPASLAGVLVASLVCMFIGKNLKDDPEYQARLKAGLIPAAQPCGADRPALPPGARWTAFIFLAAVALVVVAGFFPEVRKIHGVKAPVSMPTMIQVIMLSAAALMLAVSRIAVDAIPKTATCRSGIVALVSIFGLAWLGDTFIAANKTVIVNAIGDLARSTPWTFSICLFFASALLGSQAATMRALMPLGFALGIGPQYLIGMMGAICGPFFLPTSGLLLAAVNSDLSGTTKIRKLVFNHSFMIPGLVSTSVAVAAGLAIASLV